ncbi:sensor histidine kinase [Photobacterium damselae]|uniref:sensor histidine kinase n=1 Tax=Photobacterium damselae TaxID=38293 RepID=UPI00083A9F67|nr:HAMP domain-containing sensor histidine kinase [Photobacterium damselae]ODA26230.1 two-component sensor histidine kinase [Photobacterium damselae subsp. damselae]TLS69987.1 HAMP domain-containing histidine kinase [Photobacterium damselae subsp. damselae]TLS76110.1 HAMP domain-containing histidine kinase [Photobacterium damselae subsp. damselae]TLS86384.1 HAMP domain-containing histidine kinase [Photobacterium damselae subsp. damselae]
MVKATASKLKQYPSLYRKVRWSFGAMTFVMFALYWGVIYIAENQLEVISLHHWLDTEATRYVMDYQKDQEQAALPNKSEFSTYWSEQPMPKWLDSYNKPGFYEHLLGDEDKHFIVLKHPSGNGLLYLVFQDDADDYLDSYEDNLHYFTFFFGGLITLAMALYGVYFVRTLSKPFATIEEKISQMQPDQPAFSVDSQYSETRHIEQALLDSKNNIAGFFQREKEFSRFASHELRTPIMVIKGSADLLKKVPNQPRVALKAIDRMQQASDEMRILTETFLLLGKEQIDNHYFGEFSLDSALYQQLELLEPLFAKQDSGYQLEIKNPITAYAPESFITIVINNLIKNAFSYSIGDIHISLDAEILTITNRHDGHETYNAGYGCGLVIVERICERMSWQFSATDTGTQFATEIQFHNRS